MEGAGQLPPGKRQQRKSHKYEMRSMLSRDSSIESNSVYSSSNPASVFKEIHDGGKLLRP